MPTGTGSFSEEESTCDGGAEEMEMEGEGDTVSKAREKEGYDRA